MPPPLDVDREQVRMLVLELGCTEAAKRTGIALNTVLQWSSRGKWLAHLKEPQQRPASMTPTSVIGVIKPADALENLLREDAEATRTSLSRAARRGAAAAAEMSADAIITEAQNLKALGAMAGQVQGWASGDGNGISVNLLIQNGQV